MSTIIRIENLSKSYVLGQQQSSSYVALRDVLAEKGKALFGKGSAAKEKKGTFWALDDLSFEIKEGERLGIIGRNGAGKSTLLKVLSRIVTPTKGRVTIDGRIASLLEVGTGFHPELSGRENIFLNGSILGMSRSEIKSKFDEIVAFAEVERFLDTPVKRYSSGMYVRLAFAVAAHLEPEILIVDEVLAVGDAAFQRKCLGKMKDVAGQGRTVIFVSHNMEAVQKLCTTGVLLDKGRLLMQGPIDQVTRRYMDGGESSLRVYDIPAPDKKEEASGYITRVQIENEDNKPVAEIPVGADWQVRVFFKLNKDLPHFIAGLGIVTLLELPLRTSWSIASDLKKGEYSVLFKNTDLMLVSGQYKIVIGLSSEGRVVQYIDNTVSLTISEISAVTGDERILNSESGLILNPMEITITPLN
ncbi:MAG TPA: ABC transporter ATP-binding protein [Bacteroidia bacterium]|jgi:lipopolysaccharide transport system ATP-binding protein|nr:ABC transporter ATP-binding protein [Bacteroidia bacterium]